MTTHADQAIQVNARIPPGHSRFRHRATVAAGSARPARALIGCLALAQ